MENSTFNLTGPCGCSFSITRTGLFMYFVINTCDMKSPVEININHLKEDLIVFLENDENRLFETNFGQEKNILWIKKDFHLPQTLLLVVDKDQDFYTIHIPLETRHKIIELLRH